jgi:hypothetical protein
LAHQDSTLIGVVTLLLAVGVGMVVREAAGCMIVLLFQYIKALVVVAADMVEAS